MGRFDGHTCKLISVMGMVMAYFLIELLVGHFIQSLALIADSFHMLSDFIALLVGIISQRLTKMPRTARNTFGWQRADVVGSLINTVVLCTLCFTIFLRAIERFVEDHMVHQPLLMVAVGSGGLVINIVSLLILGHHGHSHSHVQFETQVEEIDPNEVIVTATVNQNSEKQQITQNSENKVDLDASAQPELTLNSDSSQVCTPISNQTNSTPVGYTSVSTTDPTTDLTKSPSKTDESSNEKTKCKFDENECDEDDEAKAVVIDTKTASDNAHPGDHGHSHGHRSIKMSNNFKAIMCHVFADALGSVIVVISSLIIYFAPEDAKWKRYIDPGMSIVLVIIIVVSTGKLLCQNTLILLHAVPKSVEYGKLKEKLEIVSGQNKLHDLHIWRLQSECIIGTVHIRFRNIQEYLSNCKKIKREFHKSGVHCTTIQPEFDEQDNQLKGADECVIGCGEYGDKCDPKSCCPTNSPIPEVIDHADMA